MKTTPKTAEAANSAAAKPAAVPAAAKRTRRVKADKSATKLHQIIAMLRRPEGASVAQISEFTGWQINTVRGVLAGTLKTRHRLVITSVKPGKVRLYYAAPETLAAERVVSD